MTITHIIVVCILYNDTFFFPRKIQQNNGLEQLNGEFFFFYVNCLVKVHQAKITEFL